MHSCLSPGGRVGKMCDRFCGGERAAVLETARELLRWQVGGDAGSPA